MQTDIALQSQKHTHTSHRQYSILHWKFAKIQASPALQFQSPAKKRIALHCKKSKQKNTSALHCKKEYVQCISLKKPANPLQKCVAKSANLHLLASARIEPIYCSQQQISSSKSVFFWREE